MERKQAIIEEIQKSDKPVSASKLAKHFGVSRQIIVGDIALLRAAGTQIIATPRGYLLEDKPHPLEKKIAVCHNNDRLAEELYTIIDLGGMVVNVIVDHPIYGELVGNLHLASRYDVDQFLKKVETATPLSQLTSGVHLHTIRYPSEEVLARIEKALKEKGILLRS